MIQAAAQGQTDQCDAPDEAEMEGMSAHEAWVMGERLLDAGRWWEAERFLFAQLEKGEKAGDIDHLGNV